MSEEDKPKQKILHRPVWLILGIIGLITALVIIYEIAGDFNLRYTEAGDTMRNIRGVLILFVPVAFFIAFRPKSDKKK